MLLLATGTQASATMVNYGVGPLAYFWKQEYHLTQMQTGTIISAMSIGPLVCMLLIGRMLDRWQERQIIGWGSILLGFSFMAVAKVPSFPALLFTLLVAGMFYSTAQPGGSKVVIKWFPREIRGLAMGIRQAGIPIGGGLGGLIIPPISVMYGWPSAVFVISGLCAGAGILFLIFYKEPPTSHRVSIYGYGKTFHMQIGAILKDKSLYPICFTGICMISLQMVMIGHLTIFLVHNEALTPVFAGFVYSVALFCGMAGRVLLAWISDYFFHGNRRRPFLISIVSTFLLICLFALKPLTYPVWILFLISGLLGFFGMGWYSLFIVEVAEKAEKDSVAVTVSFALTLNQAMIIAAPPLFGWIVDTVGYTWAWLSLAALVFLAGVGMWKSQ
ncbi:MFS transporter [Sporolactobacillus laevolacticus]|uniref:MFS transporter n=1 Tax=Sporolactobacillus laevolacticus TaxID=33018 RepID=UPI00041A2BFE|nr:MFS transporter [Sporolactobacillus laevolacticus]